MRPGLDRPRRRWPWLALAALPCLAIGGFIASFDATTLAPRLQAAVLAATGRALTLDGPVGLKFALTPTLTLDRAALANLPGGSRPQMLTAQRIEVALALLPLLSRRVEIASLTLIGPDLLLERDAAGTPNWRFTRAPVTPAAPPSEPARSAARFGLGIERLVVRDGIVTWQGRSLAVPALAAGGGDPLRWTGTLALDGTPFRLDATTGPLAGLGDATAPWPLRLSLAGLGATLGIDGALGADRTPQARLTASIPALAALAPLLPGLALPPLLAVTGAAELGPAGLSGLALTAGAAPLDALLPGLRLTSLSATQATASGPIALTLAASLRDIPLGLDGTIGAAILAPTAAPAPAGAGAPFDLALTTPGASATLRGTLGASQDLAGLDAALTAQAPALAALGPLTGLTLPPLREVRLASQLVGQSATALALPGFSLRSSAGDASGALLLRLGPRPSLRGTLASQRLDLDALLAAGAPPPAAPSVTRPATDRPATDRPGPDLPPVALPGGGRVIPDIALPLGVPPAAEADLRWTATELLTHGVSLRDAEAHLTLAAGQARLDPLTATLPGGRLALRLAADTTTTPPTIQLAGRSDGIDLAPLLAALGGPAGTTGRVELDADLRGQGETLRALAATAHGRAAIALINGQVEAGSASMLGRAAADLRRALPQLGLAEGRIGLACAAGRWQVEAGIARTQTLLLDGTLGRIGGTGTINLRDETLAMRLLLDLRVAVGGGTLLRIRAPVPLTGSLARPRADYGQAITRGALGALAGDPGEPPAGLLDCAQALAAVRGGRPGPQPTPLPTPQPTPQPSPQPGAQASPRGNDAVPNLPPQVNQILRDLFGRPR